MINKKNSLILFRRWQRPSRNPMQTVIQTRSSNSRSRLPGDQRSTTESTEIHGKENPNQLPLSVSFRVFGGYPFVMIFLAWVIGWVETHLTFWQWPRFT